jgi:hypothetical protein
MGWRPFSLAMTTVPATAMPLPTMTSVFFAEPGEA